MQVEIYPTSLEIESTELSKTKRNHQYIIVTFRVAGGGPEQACRLKVDFDVEFAAMIEGSISAQKALKLTIDE
jgi:hypothetical protein